MAHLILTGATGLVGSAVLVNLLARPASEVSKVTILSRRSVPIVEGKSRFETIIQKDFGTYDDALMAKLKGASAVIWAQGISVTQVDKEKYVNVTIDYPLAAAEAFSTLSDPFKFIYVSGEGASTKPGMFTQRFGVVKGQAELALLDLASKNPSFKPYSVRPGGVDPTGHPEIQEALVGHQGPWYMKFLLPVLVPAIKRFVPSQHSPTDELGQFLVDIALSKGEPLEGDDIEKGRIVPNAAARRLFKEGVLQHSEL